MYSSIVFNVSACGRMRYCTRSGTRTDIITSGRTIAVYEHRRIIRIVIIAFCGNKNNNDVRVGNRKGTEKKDLFPVNSTRAEREIIFRVAVAAAF